MSETLRSTPDAGFLDQLRYKMNKGIRVGVLALALAGCSSDSEDSERGPIETIAPSLSDSGNSVVCEWSAENPKPPIASDPLVIEVDGRCDRDPDAPVGVYPRASQIGQSIFRVFNGDQVEVICYEEGQTIQDLNSNSSEAWLLVDNGESQGFMPEVYAGFLVTEQMVDMC